MVVAPGILLSALGLFRFSIFDSQSQSQSQSQSLDNNDNDNDNDNDRCGLYILLSFGGHEGGADDGCVPISPHVCCNIFCDKYD